VTHVRTEYGLRQTLSSSRVEDPIKIQKLKQCLLVRILAEVPHARGSLNVHDSTQIFSTEDLRVLMSKLETVNGFFDVLAKFCFVVVAAISGA
jgi:hypothetical protein